MIVIAELEEFLLGELHTVIHDDRVWDSKAVDDVKKKLDGLLGHDCRDWPSFDPLCELVNGDKQVRVALRCSPEGPDQIKPPDRKWLRDRDCLECLSQQVGLSSIVLTPFTGAHDLLGVCHYGWPVETLSKCVPDQGSMRGVVPVDTAMDIIQQLFPLFDRDTLLKDLGVAPFVEIPLDDDEGLGASCSRRPSVCQLRALHEGSS
jgi:hypothetical protein